MPALAAIVSITLPFFALVLLGFMAAQRRLLPEAAIPGLNADVLYFALPCMRLRFGASLTLACLIDPVLIGVYAVCALLVVALAVTLTLASRTTAANLKDAAFPNSGFMGVSLLVALHGETAGGPVIGTLLVDLFLTSTVCLALAHVGPGHATSATPATPRQPARQGPRRCAPCGPR